VWYTTLGRLPAKEPSVLGVAADSRMQRLFCGDMEELITAVTDLVAGKEATVPHMLGTAKMLSDRTALIFRSRADLHVPPNKPLFDPFKGQASWSTHRGNPQRTGADGGPGPKG